MVDLTYGGRVPRGTVVPIPAGTYTIAQVFALSPGAGTPTAPKLFQPEAGAEVIIRGGGAYDVAWSGIDGSTGLDGRLLIDGTLDRSPSVRRMFSDISADHVTLRNFTFTAGEDRHYSYALDGTPNGDENLGAVTNSAAVRCSGRGVELVDFIAHGGGNFLSDIGGELTIRRGLVRNFHSVGAVGDNGIVTAIDSAFWDIANHGFIGSAAVGGHLTLRNNLIVLTQEMPDTSFVGTGLDYLTLEHNTFVQPTIPVSWLSGAAYQMDPMAVAGGTRGTTRAGIRLLSNIFRNTTKRVFKLSTTQASILVSDWNLWFTASTTPFDIPELGGGQSYTTYKATFPGQDTHSIGMSSAPVFLNPPTVQDPQPNPGNAGNQWGHYVPSTLVEARQRYGLARGSPGKGVARDGLDMGIVL